MILVFMSCCFLWTHHLMEAEEAWGGKAMISKAHSQLWIQSSGSLTTEPTLFIINQTRFGCSSEGRFFYLNCVSRTFWSHTPWNVQPEGSEEMILSLVFTTFKKLLSYWIHQTLFTCWAPPKHQTRCFAISHELSQILSATGCMWLFPFYQWENWCSEEWPTFPTPHNYQRRPNVHSTTSARAGLEKQSTPRESYPCFQWENPGLSQSGQSILLAMGLVQKWASIWIKKVQGKIFCSVNIIFTL